VTVHEIKPCVSKGSDPEACTKNLQKHKVRFKDLERTNVNLRQDLTYIEINIKRNQLK
jgi:hypothetical protein